MRGGFNEYPQSMFWSKNKKNRYTPRIPRFFYIKVGYKGVYISRTCFPDENMRFCINPLQNFSTHHFAILLKKEHVELVPFAFEIELIGVHLFKINDFVS